eukprot:scaffold31598_cov17-Tisochrysis_lutea.AAC.1
MQATRITCRSCSQLRPPSDRELRTHTAAMGIDLSLLTRSARRGGMVPADARAQGHEVEHSLGSKGYQDVHATVCAAHGCFLAQLLKTVMHPQHTTQSHICLRSSSHQGPFPPQCSFPLNGKLHSSPQDPPGSMRAGAAARTCLCTASAL